MEMPNIIYLSEEGWNQFLTILENPQEPAPELVNLFKRCRDLNNG